MYILSPRDGYLHLVCTISVAKPATNKYNVYLSEAFGVIFDMTYLCCETLLIRMLLLPPELSRLMTFKINVSVVCNDVHMTRHIFQTIITRSNNVLHRAMG